MFKPFDRSKTLLKLIQNLSSFIGKRRGLLIVAGIFLIALGFIIELLNVAAGNSVLSVLHIILRNVGIIVALIGILLIEPLGN